MFRVSFNLIIDTKSSVVNFSDFHSLGVYSFFVYLFFEDCSCLPCGHIYGMSCIKKWLQQRVNSGKVLSAI